LSLSSYRKNLILKGGVLVSSIVGMAVLWERCRRKHDFAATP
jgi:hypothetical protein